MAHVGPTPTPAAGVTSVAVPAYVEWGAIFAGAVLAAALSFVFLTFGAAIGLSAASPWPNSGASVKFIAGLAVFWTMVQQIGAFMAGGYIAGRMRSRWNETTQHEVEFRDGLHGGLVWAVGLVIGVAILMASAGAAARTGIETAGKAAAITASTVDPTDVLLDTMLRPASVAQATPQNAPPAGAPASAAARCPQSRRFTRGDVPYHRDLSGEWIDVRPRPRIPCPDRSATDWRDAAGSREARQRSVHGCS